MPKQSEQLTAEQIANWKRAFPEFRFYSDEMIQRLRDVMQRRANEISESTPAREDNEVTKPEQLADLYERNDAIERELNKLNHNYKLSDGNRKTELLNELQGVIDAIEKLEG